MAEKSMAKHGYRASAVVMDQPHLAKAIQKALRPVAKLTHPRVLGPPLTLQLANDELAIPPHFQADAGGSNLIFLEV
jgi:hypothetical protein